ncbi:unnamed protein product [Paramecium pentaurelia]|uniref:non-specific serine/threonine protein kinase n=1 Tax=Paramecium pentaurelia TaxID=43138 RepID=A0A8S1VWS9_9CILI|nr:unnamed protein product [Paramecium pentaurelia]
MAKDTKGKLFCCQNDQFIIKQVDKSSKDEIEVLEQIRIQQKYIKPKCQYIIKILGIEEKESFYIQMEKGKDNISNLIKSNTSLSEFQKIKIFEQMVKGVIELHDLGYFHRDLKPENFVYFQNENQDYQVKLIDFGLVINSSSNLKTQQVGTFNYMAPEVMLEEGTQDKTADIWSLGIILYELLTKQNFFQANNVKNVVKEGNNLNQEEIDNRINQFVRKGQPQYDLINSMLQKERKNRIDLKTLLQKIEQNLQKIKEIEIQQIQQIQQQLTKSQNDFLDKIQNFIQILTKKEKTINQINIEDQEKQQLSIYIKKEQEKYSENIKKNEQKLQQIQQIQTKENLKEYETQLAQESEQFIQDKNFIMEYIQKQQSLLEKQLKDKELSDQYRKEKEYNQSLFEIVKKQYNQQFLQIKTISEQIKYYQRIKLQFQGEVKIQDVIQQQQIITQDIQVLEQQERMIQQFDQIQLIPHYQYSNSKLEELQQSQKRLKILIEEANKCLKQIDNQYLDEHHKQIDDLNNTLNDILEKFKCLSKNKKYASKINIILNQIEKDFRRLNFLKEKISQRNEMAYQEFEKKYQKIQSSLKEYSKFYNQWYQWIYNDDQTYNKTYENVEEQLQSFFRKINEFTEQIDKLINNQYCKNDQKVKLNNQRQNIDQTKQELYNQFETFKQIQQSNSCESIDCQIQFLEEFQKKIKQKEKDKIEQVEQLKQEIEDKYKSEQENEILELNNQLQNRYKEFSKAFQQSIEFYKKEHDKKEKLEKQLQEEIKILEEYLEIQNLNSQLFIQELNDIKTQRGYLTQQIEEMIKKLQQTNKYKGDRLKIVANKVFEKSIEINFTEIDDNLIQNYEQLKMQEEQLQIELNQINDKISNQQLNPQQLNELKDYILKIYSNINELQMKISKDNDLYQQFNKDYQQNLESYEKLYALVNYIKQYHLTRYYERIKENKKNEQKQKQQNKDKNDYQKLFQSKLNEAQEEKTKKEKEAQDIFQRYENILFKSYCKMAIESMEKDQEEIEKQIQEQENQLKQKYLVKLQGNLKNQSIIKEIFNVKQYYKMQEFAQMLILNMIIKK